MTEISNSVQANKANNPIIQFIRKENNIEGKVAKPVSGLKFSAH